jgi:LPS sulfotransferase NodH
MLESTGVAGFPNEWFNAAEPQNLVQHYGAVGVPDLVNTLYKLGSTPNGVFGVKQPGRQMLST